MQLAKNHDEILATETVLWAISPQGISQNRALVRRYDLPFPILADAQQRLIRSWGLFDHLDPKRRPIPYPSTYLIAPDGIVRWRYLGHVARDRPAIAEILARLRED